MFKTVLAQINQIVNKIVAILLTAMFTVMVIIVTINVVCRYVFRAPLFWVTEAACYILVYLIFFGASLALARGEHVVVDTSRFKISPVTAKVITVICDVLMYAFLVLFVFFGADLTLSNLHSFTGVLPVPTAVFYAAAPISGVFMLIQYTEIVVSRRDQ